MRVSVARDLPGDEDRQEYRQHKPAVEGEIHRLGPKNLAHENQNGSYEESYLDARSDGNRHGQVHAVLHGRRDGGGVFGGVTQNCHHEHADKDIIHPEFLGRRLDRPHQDLTHPRDRYGGCPENQYGAADAPGCLVRFFIMCVRPFEERGMRTSENTR